MAVKATAAAPSGKPPMSAGGIFGAMAAQKEIRRLNTLRFKIMGGREVFIYAG